MFESIVVPLDGSVLAEGALATAVDLGRRMSAKLTLVRVHQAPEMAITHAYEWDRDTRRRETEYLEHIATCLRERFDVEADPWPCSMGTRPTPLRMRPRRGERRSS